jgi:Tol biopolymer transport system component
VNAAGTDGSNGDSTSPVFSADGTKVAFVSTGSNLGPVDTGKSSCYPAPLNPPPPGAPCQDVYVRDLTTGTTTLVSTNAAGTDSANAASSAPVFSPDGDVVAFESYASDLGPPDTRANCLIFTIPGQGPVFGPCLDVYARDLGTGTTSMISVNAAGTNGGSASASRRPVFSPDGTSVAFESSAGDLVGPTAHFPYAELLLRDLTSGTTSLISAAPTGAPGNGESEAAVFSPDGTKVLFSSSSSNLGPTHSIDPGNVGLDDLYIRDLATGTISQVTINAAGTDGGLGSGGSFSPDGEVVYDSLATNLGPTDTNGGWDIYIAAATPPPSP